MLPMRRIVTPAVLLHIASLAMAGDVIGYAIESGSTHTASCDDAYAFTSLSGTTAACTNTYNGQDTTYTLLYFFSCSGSTLVKASVAGPKGNVATSTLATYKCLNQCSTITIYETYLSATPTSMPTSTPTFELAICLTTDDMYTTDTFVAGVDGNLPTDVKKLYRQQSSVPTTSASSTPSGSLDHGSPKSKVPIIVGSVVGSLAAIGLVALAVFFGCRRMVSRKPVAQPLQFNDGQGGGAELDSRDCPGLPGQKEAAAVSELAYTPTVRQELDSGSLQKHEAPDTSYNVHERSGYSRVYELPS